MPERGIENTAGRSKAEVAQHAPESQRRSRVSLGAWCGSAMLGIFLEPKNRSIWWDARE